MIVVRSYNTVAYTHLDRERSFITVCNKSSVDLGAVEVSSCCSHGPGTLLLLDLPKGNRNKRKCVGFNGNQRFRMVLDPSRHAGIVATISSTTTTTQQQQQATKKRGWVELVDGMHIDLTDDPTLPPLNKLQVLSIAKAAHYMLEHYCHTPPPPTATTATNVTLPSLILDRAVSDVLHRQRRLFLGRSQQDVLRYYQSNNVCLDSPQDQPSNTTTTTPKDWWMQHNYHRPICVSPNCTPCFFQSLLQQPQRQQDTSVSSSLILHVYWRAFGLTLDYTRGHDHRILRYSMRLDPTEPTSTTTTPASVHYYRHKAGNVHELRGPLHLELPQKPNLYDMLLRQQSLDSTVRCPTSNNNNHNSTATRHHHHHHQEMMEDDDWDSIELLVFTEQWYPQLHLSTQSAFQERVFEFLLCNNRLDPHVRLNNDCLSLVVGMLYQVEQHDPLPVFRLHKFASDNDDDDDNNNNNNNNDTSNKPDASKQQQQQPWSDLIESINETVGMGSVASLYSPRARPCRAHHDCSTLWLPNTAAEQQQPHPQQQEQQDYQLWRIEQPQRSFPLTATLFRFF